MEQAIEKKWDQLGKMVKNLLEEAHAEVLRKMHLFIEKERIREHEACRTDETPKHSDSENATHKQSSAIEKPPTISPGQGATSITLAQADVNNKSQEKWVQLLKLEDTLKILIGWMFGLLEIIRKIQEVEDSRKAEQMEQLRHIMHGSLGVVDGLHILEKYWRSLFEDLKRINND